MKGQEELNRALANEATLQQQVHELEKQLRQAQENHQKEQEAKEAEIQRIKYQNEELIKKKDKITQEHIQEAYITNLNLHRQTIWLEATLQSTKSLLHERAQQIRKLEEIPKLPMSLDDQLETKHTLIMEASSNIVSLALEHRMVDQTLTCYFNAFTASFVQYSVDLI